MKFLKALGKVLVCHPPEKRHDASHPYGKYVIHVSTKFAKNYSNCNTKEQSTVKLGIMTKSFDSCLDPVFAVKNIITTYCPFYVGHLFM